MTKYVLDSYAWIEYLDGSEKGRFVRELLFDTKNEAITASICVAEVVSKVNSRKQDVTKAVEAMQQLSTLHLIDGVLAEETGMIHSEIRNRIKDFGLADAFVLTTARRLGAKIVTGDPHFKNMKNVVFLA